MKKVTKASGSGNKVYSGALNNLHYLSGSVDPQTCFFSSAITFGNLIGDRTFGARFSLQMSFGALNTMGGDNSRMLGLGWSMMLPSYDGNSDMITFPDGRSYKVDTSGMDWNEGTEINRDYPWTTSHKLKDVQVYGTIDGRNKTVVILTKDGTKYLLTVENDTGWLSKIVAPDGRCLDFEQEDEGYGVYRLVRVTDTGGDILVEATPDYTFNKTTIVLYPNTPVAQTFCLEFENDDTLASITLSEDSGDLETTFHYENRDIPLKDGGSSKMYLLQEVHQASGAVEIVEYENQIKLPPSFPWKDYLPAVSMYTRRNATEEEEVSNTYTLDPSGKNFFGNELLGITWEDAADSLANSAATDYYYENTVVESGLKSSKYKYNKFHQVIELEQCFVAFPDQKRITKFGYYSNDQITLNAEGQDPRYELQNMREDTLQEGGNVKTLILTSEFDDCGNETRKANPDGTLEEHTYYLAEGEGLACPAHPFGMRAYRKNSTVVAAATARTAASKVSSYTYKSLAGIDGGTFVALATEDQDGQLTTSTYSGESSAAPLVHGSLAAQSVSYGGKAYTLSYGYEFDDAAHTLKRTESIVGFDGCTASRSETKCWRNEWIMGETDPNGISTVYTYDKVGRVITKCIAPDSDYESTTSYAYFPLPAIDPESDFANLPAEIGAGWLIREWNTAEMRDDHTVYDGAKNERQSYTKHVDGKHYKITEKTYDSLGRVKVEHGFDYAIESGTRYAETLTHTYGSWGARSESIDSTGLIHTTLLDPFLLQVTRQLIRRDKLDAPATVTESRFAARSTYNLFGDEVRTELLDMQNEVIAQTTIEYDGFGRKLSVTSPEHNTLRISGYDAFDRPSKIQQSDGFEYEYAYAVSSTRPIVSSITLLANPALDASLVSPYVVGGQTFDGLERVIERDINGIKTQFGYAGGMRQANRAVNARKQTTLFDLIPELGNAPARIATFGAEVANDLAGWADESKQSDSTFTYGPIDVSAPLGQIAAANTGDDALTYSYTSVGKVSSFTQKVNELAKTSTVIKATVLGKMLEINVGDRNIQLQYDAQGGIAEMRDGTICTVIQENSFGDISQESIYVSGSLLQQTDIHYDDRGREDNRKIKAIAQDYEVSYALTYDREGKLLGRTTTVKQGVGNEDNMVESYCYDAKRRLKTFEVTAYSDAALLPRDGQGNAFTKQEFAYGPLDNLKTLTTDFPNSDQDVATFNDVAHRLQTITHTLQEGSNAYPALIAMGYDLDGNLTEMGDEQMEYTVPGRLKTHDGNRYGYDAFERMTHTGTHARYYMNAQAIGEHDGSGETQFIRMGDAPIGERTDGQWTLYGRDQKASIVTATTQAAARHISYTPQGGGDNGLRFGFNGELRDTRTGAYHLGNGQRAYMPQVAGFLSMDSFSPFQGGGLNPYCYCNGDPVNFTDPSGHMKSGTQLGLDIAFLLIDLAAIGMAIFTGGASLSVMAAVGVASSALGAVSGVLAIAGDSLQIKDEKKGTDSSETIRNLGLASSVFGLASIVTGGFEGVGKNWDDMKQGQKGAESALKKTSRVDPKDPKYKQLKKEEGRHRKAESEAKGKLRSPEEWGKSVLKGVTGFDKADYSMTPVYNNKIRKVITQRPKINKASAMCVLTIGRQVTSLVFMVTGTWTTQPPDLGDLPQDSFNTPQNE